MHSHTIGTSITELAQVWASALQMGSGTVVLPCEAYKATDVLKFHWTLLFRCYPVIPRGTVSSANYSWMLIMLILLWCKEGRGTLHLEVAQDSSYVESWVIRPVGLVVLLYFLYSGCCFFIDLVGLETTILSTDVDNPSCTGVSISRAENLAVASQSWNGTELLPKWDECFVKMVPSLYV